MIVTSDEITCDLERASAHRPPLIPHIERNLFHTGDFQAVWGGEPEIISQQKGLPPSDSVSDEEAAAWILAALSDPSPHPMVGSMITLMLDPDAARTSPLDQKSLMDCVLKTRVPLQPLKRNIQTLGHDRLEALRCPVSGEALVRRGDTLIAPDTGAKYSIDEEIPVLFGGGDIPLSTTTQRLRTLHGGDTTAVQAALKVRKRLETPVPPPREYWDFSQESARQEWMASPGTSLEAHSNALDFASDSPNPFLIGPPVRYPETGIASFEIDLEIMASVTGAGVPTGRIYWLGPTDAGFADERSLAFELPPPGTRRQLSVPMASPPHHGEERLDFIFRLDPPAPIEQKTSRRWRIVGFLSRSQRSRGSPSIRSMTTKGTAVGPTRPRDARPMEVHHDEVTPPHSNPADTGERFRGSGLALEPRHEKPLHRH